MKNLVKLTILVMFLSCQNTNKGSGNLESKENFILPDCIESVIRQRIENDPQVPGFAIAFNLSVDSTKFVVSDINKLEFVVKYPPSIYSFRKEKFLLIYSGLEGFKKKQTEIPDEIKKVLIVREKKIKTMMVEPFHVRYSYSNFDSCLSAMSFDTLPYNSLLPFTVRLIPIVEK